MSEFVKIAFVRLAAPEGRHARRFRRRRSEAGRAGRRAAGRVRRPRSRAAAETVGFKGKSMTALDILAPAGLRRARLLVVGVAPGKDGKPLDFAHLGGFVAGKLGKAKTVARRSSNRPARRGTRPRRPTSRSASGCARYKFDKYKTKKPNADENGDGADRGDDLRRRPAGGARRARRARSGRRGRRTRARPGQRAAERAVSGNLRRARRRRWRSSASTSRFSTRRR